MSPPLIPIAQLFATMTPDEVMSTWLSICTQLGLPITAWESGSAGRTLGESWTQQSSANYSAISVTIQGGFLDYAALVTADPSVTPGAAPGWLDALSSSTFNLSNGQGGIGRFPATYAPGVQSFTNTGGSAGPYAAGTLHVVNPTTGATYSNVASVTLGNGTTTAAFQADFAGTTGTSSAGQVSALVTPLIGITTTNAAGYVGQNAESNAAVVSRCRAKWGSISPNGPHQAYDYFAKTIPPPSPLVALSSGLLTSPANRVTRTKPVVNTATGTVTNYVANASGPYVAPDLYTGSANEAITGVTNANPAAITIVAHGYLTGDNIYITGTGITALDGKTFSITKTGADTFTVPVLSGATSSAGSAYRQSDLGLIDKTVQTYCVPLGTTAITLTAPGNSITVTGTIYLKRGSTLSAANAQTIGLAALTAYFATLPLGGDDVGGSTFYFLIEPMQNVVRDAMPNDCLQCKIASPSADVAVTTPQDVATLNVASSFSVVNEI